MLVLYSTVVLLRAYQLSRLSRWSKLLNTYLSIYLSNVTAAYMVQSAAAGKLDSCLDPFDVGKMSSNW